MDLKSTPNPMPSGAKTQPSPERIPVMETRSSEYNRPVVLVLDNSDAFVRRVVREEYNPSTNVDWRAEKLKDFIDSHSAGDRLSIEEVCKEIGLPTSVRQTRRLFKTSTGISVRKYAKNKRLAFAARQLQATRTPIKVIALEIGYRRTAEFTSSFKELFRLSPPQFRTVWRKSKLVPKSLRPISMEHRSHLSH